MQLSEHETFCKWSHKPGRLNLRPDHFTIYSVSAKYRLTDEKMRIKISAASLPARIRQTGLKLAPNKTFHSQSFLQTLRFLLVSPDFSWFLLVSGLLCSHTFHNFNASIFCAHPERKGLEETRHLARQVNAELRAGGGKHAAFYQLGHRHETQSAQCFFFFK